MVSTTITSWVLANRQAAIFGDARRDTRSMESVSVHVQSVRSCMAAPLVPGDHPIGVLYVDDHVAAGRFGDDDLQLLCAFANQVAIAIDNAWLRRELEAQARARTTLERFFPPAAIPLLLRSEGRLEAVETEVTALFCDIVDYTRLSANLSPRQVIGLLNRYFEVVSNVVFRHGGTLEKYIGDAVLAVWNAPLPVPDHADRALTAARELARAVERIEPRIAVRVGLNTGRVAAGNVGTATYLQFATIGDATNVAARVCALSEPGEVAVTEATWSRLAAPPAGSPAERLVVKGKDDPVVVVRVR
jgi:adenylate cyclase